MMKRVIVIAIAGVVVAIIALGTIVILLDNVAAIIALIMIMIVADNVNFAAHAVTGVGRCVVCRRGFSSPGSFSALLF